VLAPTTIAAMAVSQPCQKGCETDDKPFSQIKGLEERLLHSGVSPGEGLKVSDIHWYLLTCCFLLNDSRS
jgi:hypothetical protein